MICVDTLTTVFDRYAARFSRNFNGSPYEALIYILVNKSSQDASRNLTFALACIIPDRGCHFIRAAAP